MDDIPVISANLYKPIGYTNKEYGLDYNNVLLFSIDGVWMTRVLKNHYKFYPTDHCGVITLKENIFDVDLDYLGLVLKYEYDFNRSNRASIKKIKELVVELPSIEVQEKVMNEINNIKCKINHLNIRDLDFNKIFYDLGVLKRE